jgi:hypothetical protein
MVVSSSSSVAACDESSAGALCVQLSAPTRTLRILPFQNSRFARAAELSSRSRQLPSSFAALQEKRVRGQPETASQQKQKQNRITTETKTKLINRNEVKYQTLCTQPHLLLQSLQLSVHVDQAYRAQVNNPQQGLAVGS